MTQTQRQSAIPQAIDLVDLARDRSAEGRQQLLIGVAVLCDRETADADVAESLKNLLLELAGQAERDIRRSLADRLSHADWAPKALVNVLALDEIEIARPILAHSPLLQDADLVRILVQSTVAHQVEIAQRAGIGRGVTTAIIRAGEPDALMALAQNTTADVSEAGFAQLLDYSRSLAGLRAPLTQHPLLTRQLAGQLYAWVGASLRHAISERFSVDEARLAGVVGEAVADLHRPAPPTRPGSTETDETARILVAKLQAAGQLRSSFLIRALREHRLAVFTHALSTLSGYGVEAIRRALDASTPESLFYACTIVGIDRAAFPGLLSDVRRLNASRPGDGGDGSWMRRRLSLEQAATAFADSVTQ